MREILFRGKKTTNGEWVVGNYARNVVDAKFDTIEDCENFPYLIYGIDRETVGQYVCLDKNGKRIFEGDVVKIPDDYDLYGHNAGEVYEVYFAFGGFRLKPKRNSKARGYWLEDDKEVEVIGNVHDNPELIAEVEG